MIQRNKLQKHGWMCFKTYYVASFMSCFSYERRLTFAEQAWHELFMYSAAESSIAVTYPQPAFGIAP